MVTKYEVVAIDSRYYPPSVPGQITHSSFSVPPGKIFESREDADKYVLSAKQENPGTDFSIREIEAA